MGTQADDVELSPRIALLFGLAAPHGVPEHAPRRTNRLRHEDEGGEMPDGAALPSRMLLAKGRRARLLAWLKAGRVARTTSECGEYVQLDSQTVIHDLMALERGGRVARGTREVARKESSGRRTVTTWSFVK